MTPRQLPPDSIRGRIRSWLEKHADKLGDDVLEVGGRIHDPAAAWYLNNRYLAKGTWTVVDMQAGDNVDLVADVSHSKDWWVMGVDEPFTGIVCSEVLEHCARPWVVLSNLSQALAPGGYIVITVPFGFHRHAYPNDYYRFTAEGLGVILADAGFVEYEYEYGGDNVITIKNDDGPAFQKRLETQLFAIARKPL